MITPQLPFSLFLSFLINQYNSPIKGIAQIIQNINDAPVIYVSSVQIIFLASFRWLFIVVNHGTHIVNLPYQRDCY